MAKGPGVSATSHIIATSQTNVHYYIKNRNGKQGNFQNVFISVQCCCRLIRTVGEMEKHENAARVL